MTRAILLTLGWAVSAAGLYALLVALELYWNFWDWQLDLDPVAWGLMVGMFGFVVAVRLLAPATRDSVSQVVSLVLCLALLVLGIYVCPPEPLTHGLFGREQSSPFWYRFGRLVVLALPSVMWIRGLTVRKRFRTQSSAAAHDAS